MLLGGKTFLQRGLGLLVFAVFVLSSYTLFSAQKNNLKGNSSLTQIQQECLDTTGPVQSSTRKQGIFARGELGRDIIGSRSWSRLAEKEIVEGREGWEHANMLLKQWNKKFMAVDEEDFLVHRPDQGVGHFPGFAWARWASEPSDEKPVRFVPHKAPSPILLPKCDIDVHKYAGEKALEGGVAMCLILRDEERFLAEWVHYYYFLGARRVVLYDHGSVDGTKAIAERFSPLVEYVDWSHVKDSKYDGHIQVQAYQDCYRRLEQSGITWLGYLDIDELLVFTENPAQLLDDYLESLSKQQQGDRRVGSVGINWQLMTSNLVALPDPAFQSLDMPYTFEGGGDGAHHVKVFARVEATSAELVTHAHFVSLKPGWGQFDAAGTEMDVGPFTKESVFRPARLNHCRTRSLQDWTLKVNKRANGSQGNVGNVYGAIDSLQELRAALSQPEKIETMILSNIVARQGCI